MYAIIVLQAKHVVTFIACRWLTAEMIFILFLLLALPVDGVHWCIYICTTLLLLLILLIGGITKTQIMFYNKLNGKLCFCSGNA